MLKLYLNLDDVKKPLPLQSGYQIRTYKKGDASEWIKIIKGSFGKSYEPPEITIEKIVNTPHFDPESLLFATYNSKPVGTVCANTIYIGWMKIGFIHMVAVCPEHRGKELGISLTFAGLQYFKNMGLHRVILYTDDSRIYAIRIYRKLGFRPLDAPGNKAMWAKVLESL
jgi:mycothiol synthase